MKKKNVSKEQLLEMKLAAANAFIEHYVKATCEHFKESPEPHLAQYQSMLADIADKYKVK